MEYSKFFNRVLPSVFKGLPGGQDMRIGWRQLIRGGKYAGQIVEDIGVLSDVIVRPQAKDFFVGRTNFSQIQTISQSLKVDGRRTGLSFLSCIYFK